jgi:hypothetical protein
MDSRLPSSNNELSTMGNLPEGRTSFERVRLAILYCLFFLITLGLGYPILNRYDPRQTAGLTDVQSYAALVTGQTPPGAPHVRFRVLVPWVARPFYLAAKGRSGSWDPVMFGLLTADALFVAATALLIVILGTRQLGSYPVSLVASLLYLVNFAVPNLRLAGLVDAGEGFFLLAFLWALSENELWNLPFIAVLGALTKESFIPLSIAFTAAWWLVARSNRQSQAQSAIWIIASWAAGFLTEIGLQRVIADRWVTPIEFASAMHGNSNYLGHFASSLWERNLLYVFIWLLPMGMPGLRRLPMSWVIPTAAAAATVFAVDGYYGGAPGTVSRALFSVAGPLLALSSASFLCDWNPRVATSEVC